MTFAKTRSFELKSFDKLCNNATPQGEAYGQAIHANTVDLMSAYQPDTTGEIGIVSIPRGGVPTAHAIKDWFGPAANGKIHLIESGIKTTTELMPQDLFYIGLSAIIISDGIIGTGKTITDHLDQIPETWEGKTIVASNAATELGVQNISEWAEKKKRHLDIVTARVFSGDECEWVQFPDKQVYFVGYNKERGIDYALPDFGDHIQPCPKGYK